MEFTNAEPATVIRPDANGYPFGALLEKRPAAAWVEAQRERHGRVVAGTYQKQ